MALIFVGKKIYCYLNFVVFKFLVILPLGSVATAEDPAAITTIQSAATFTDQPIKYLFKTEGAGGQVKKKKSPALYTLGVLLIINVVGG